jgi:ABC-2 type transport system ATP-binding protein
MTDPQPAVSLQHVSKSFRLYQDRNQSLKAALLRRGRSRYDEFAALSDVSFDIETGSTFGLMGRNGSGKSTLLKCIARIYQPDSGRVLSRGRIAAMLELGSGFHPELSGRDNVFLNGAILGLSQNEMVRRFDEIVDFSGIEQYIDQPVKNYSSGMYVRLGFAVAIHVEPDVLLVDEVLAVGDQSFQEKCLAKFAEYRRDGRTVVVVSHDLTSMRTFCDEVAWLEHGRLSDLGPAASVIDRYADTAHAESYESRDGQRFGSWEVRVSAVELLAPDETPLGHACTGEGAVLRVHYEADEPVRNPVFGLSVETLEGHVLWVSHSRNDGISLDLLAGPGSIDVVVTHLMLQPGVYDVSASITDYDVLHFYDMYRRCMRLEVHRGPYNDSDGVVSLGSRWRAGAG